MCSLGWSLLSGLVVIVLVRKMVMLVRRCKASLVHAVGFVLAVTAKGNASKSRCRNGECTCLSCHTFVYDKDGEMCIRINRGRFLSLNAQNYLQ